MWRPEEKRPLLISTSSWKDNFKADLREVGLGGMEWIDLLRVTGVRLF